MRRRLALLVTATTTIVVVAFLAPLTVLVREIAVERAMSAGTRDAQSIAALVGLGTNTADLAQALDAANRDGGRITGEIGRASCREKV